MTPKQMFIAILSRIFCFHKYKLESTTKFFANSENKYLILVDLQCLKCTKKKKITTFSDN